MSNFSVTRSNPQEQKHWERLAPKQSAQKKVCQMFSAVVMEENGRFTVEFSGSKIGVLGFCPGEI